MMASFFDNLRSGVQHIETEVKRLKQMTDNSYQRSEEQVMADLMKAKQFDSNVRTTYVEVTQLYNEVKGADRPLIAFRSDRRLIQSMATDTIVNVITTPMLLLPSVSNRSSSSRSSMSSKLAESVISISGSVSGYVSGKRNCSTTSSANQIKHSITS
ncbi:unnamed protein product [Oppiella nova]|uniref:Uncharacterized protein n=1 Tax=Oppiella nova TaxID=334625 RepID=A0A7R9LBV0_9ACAR|nr:unnamed protein product [Oppiella nova]CAG2161995.1 unnamed protein product [Oppiella nova]